MDTDGAAPAASRGGDAAPGGGWDYGGGALAMETTDGPPKLSDAAAAKTVGKFGVVVGCAPRLRQGLPARSSWRAPSAAAAVAAAAKAAAAAASPAGG